MSEVAVGIPMFSRVEKLSEVLDSIEGTAISKVYIADNGHITSAKQSLYGRDHSFDLELFDVEYNSGTGNCRRTLTDQTEEEFLIILDSDISLPKNYSTLIEQLQSAPAIGGVSGMLLEGGRIYTSARDIREADGVLDVYTPQEKTPEQIAGSFFFRFDFVPNVGAFRRECLDDYSWDRSFRGGEHIDFFMGHKRTTDWLFGINPSVLFPHDPGGSSEYQDAREQQQARSENREDFFRKWDINELRPLQETWIDTYPHYKNPDRIDRLKQTYDDQGPLAAVESASKYVVRNLSQLMNAQ